MAGASPSCRWRRRRTAPEGVVTGERRVAMASTTAFPRGVWLRIASTSRRFRPRTSVVFLFCSSNPFTKIDQPLELTCRVATSELLQRRATECDRK
eukprot:6665961-Prymnesium_polylepis.1